MNVIYLKRALRLLLVIGIVILGIIVAYYAAKLLYPFIIGFIMAFLINPLVNLLEKKIRLPRALAVLIGLILIFALFAGLITLLVAEIISGADYLADVVPRQLETLINYLEDFVASQIIPLYNQLAHLFKSLDAGQQDTILTNIENMGNAIVSSVGQFLKAFFEKIPDFFSWIPGAASVFIFSLLATFFISKDWDRLKNFFLKWLPSKAKSSSLTVFNDLKKALFGFIKAQLTLVSMTTVIILVGLLILRVKYAILIALITGILDLLPYLGTGLVFVPWIIYEFITGGTKLAIGLTVLYIIVLVQRQLVEPKVLSSNIGMDPLATLVSLFVGFKLLGFIGLIAGPVTLVLLTTLHRANVFKDIWKYIKGNGA